MKPMEKPQKQAISPLSKRVLALGLSLSVLAACGPQSGAPRPGATAARGAPSALVEEVKEPACTMLTVCLAKLDENARANPLGGIDPETEELAELIAGFGAPAINPLMARLKSTDPGIAERAAFVLASVTELADEGDTHAPDLIVAYNRGNDFALPAIAATRSTLARDYFIDTLRLNPDPRSPIAQVMIADGADSSIALAESLRCYTPCADDYVDTVALILNEMGHDARPGLEILVDRAKNRKAFRSRRIDALIVLSSTGQYVASRADEVVPLLKDRNAAIRSWSVSALQSMGHPSAVPGLVAKLKTAARNQNAWIVDELRALAEMGPAAITATPDVAALLSHPVPETRIEAAETLGWIGGADALRPLLGAMGDETDWRLQYAAVESLGLIGAEAALPHIAAMKESHWLPAMRTEAARVADSLKEGSGPEPFNRQAVYDRVRGLKGKQLDAAHVCTSGRFNINGTTVQFEADKGVELAANEKALIDATLAGTVTYAHRVNGGLFVLIGDGDAKGLYWSSGVAVPELVLRGREIVSVHGTADRAIIITGESEHFDFGRLEVASPDGSDWAIRRLIELPGFPGKGVMTLEDGRLLIPTVLSPVILEPTGKLTAAPCDGLSASKKKSRRRRG